jgi:NAD-dependent dihydropyrimidine dehydrogenase PreA subunit
MHIVEPLEVRLADCVFTVCEAAQRTVGALKYAKKGANLGVVYNTFPNFDYEIVESGILRKELSLDKDKIIVVTVGRVVKEKGHQDIIEAIKQIQDDRFIYVIVGDGPYIEEYKKQCKNEIENRKVFLLGIRRDVKEILKDSEGNVAGIIFKKCVSVKDETGRFNPKFDENETITIPCKHVVLAVGQSIVWGDLLEGSKVELGRGNGAVADAKTYQTGEPDIFVGGDVYTGPKFAIDAIAAGKEAATSIHRFVQPHTSLTIGRNQNDYVELDKDDILVESYDNSSRQIPGKRSDVAAKTFRDAKAVFTEEQVKKETARCLGCGASVVDEKHCIGCGVCTTECEFDAIHLLRANPECSTMRKSEDKMKYILPYAAKQAINIKFKKKK